MLSAVLDLQAVGGAVLLTDGGVIRLVDSVFASNFAPNETDGVGVTNLGGQVLCDARGCMSVCTACRDDTEAPSPAPAPVPTPPPPARHDAISNTMAKFWPFVISTCASICVLFVIMQVLQTRRAAASTGGDPRWGIQLAHPDRMTHQDAVPLVNRNDSGYSSWAMMEMSPAPIFVVNRDMHISLWSPGMASAAPLPITPVGRHLSELPFVNENSGNRLNSLLCGLFDAPDADHRGPQRLMLYLHTKEGPVLFDMAAHVAGAGSTTVIVVTGRQIESDLGILISDERSTSWTETSESESNADGYKPFVNCYSFQSEISSLTAPSIKSRKSRTTLESEISTLTGPTISTWLSRRSGGENEISKQNREGIESLRASLASNAQLPLLPTLSSTNETTSTNSSSNAEGSTSFTEATTAQDLHTAPSTEATNVQDLHTAPSIEAAEAQDLHTAPSF